MIVLLYGSRPDRQEKEIQIHVNQADPDSKVLCLQCCMCDQQFRHMCIFMKVK